MSLLTVIGVSPGFRMITTLPLIGFALPCQFAGLDQLPLPDVHTRVSANSEHAKSAALSHATVRYNDALVLRSYR